MTKIGRRVARDNIRFRFLSEDKRPVLPKGFQFVIRPQSIANRAARILK